MEATKDRKVFGNRGEPRVEVNLPLFLNASELHVTLCHYPSDGEKLITPFCSGS